MKLLSKISIVIVTWVALIGSVYAQVARTPDEPVISKELIQRLITRTLASDKDAWVNPRTCLTLAICDGTSNMPAKRIVYTQPDCEHAFMVPLKEVLQILLLAASKATSSIII